MTAAVLALDHGTRRIGIALGKEGYVQALPWLEADDSFFDKLRKVVEAETVSTIVVGLPEGVQKTIVERFIEKLEEELPTISVVPWDEVLTTQQAVEQALDDEVPQKKRMHLDSAAAAILLEEYFAHHA